MKLKFFFFIVTVTCFLSAAGQKRVDDFESTLYGPGAKKVTTVSTDEKLNRIVTIEIIDKDKMVRVRSTWIHNVEGKWSEEIVTYSPGGKILCKVNNELDKDKKLVRNEVYGPGYPKIIYVRAANGDMLATDDGSIFPEAETVEKRMQEDIKEIEEKTIPSLEPGATPCSQVPGSNCQPKTRLFFGYSYLNADLGNKRESFLLGAQASFVINLSPHIAIGPDISFHTKKINDQTITRMYFLAKAQYDFFSNKDNGMDTLGNPDFSFLSCPRVIPDLHVYIGYSTERSVIKIGNNRNTNSGGGFTFGAGVGTQIKLGKSIGLGIQVDYLGTKFKDSDDINSDIRGSAGVFFNMGNLVHEMKFGR